VPAGPASFSSLVIGSGDAASRKVDGRGVQLPEPTAPAVEHRSRRGGEELMQVGEGTFRRDGLEGQSASRRSRDSLITASVGSAGRSKDVALAIHSIQADMVAPSQSLPNGTTPPRD
jgi:hypothetical protein